MAREITAAELARLLEGGARVEKKDVDREPTPAIDLSYVVEVVRESLEAQRADAATQQRAVALLLEEVVGALRDSRPDLSALVETLARQPTPVTETPRPAYEFSVGRDARGRIESITATPSTQGTK